MDNYLFVICARMLTFDPCCHCQCISVFFFVIVFYIEQIKNYKELLPNCYVSNNDHLAGIDIQKSRNITKFNIIIFDA